MEKDKLTYKIPEGWIWTTIGEVGIVTSGGTPSTRISEYWGGNIPWVTPADLSDYDKVYISKGARSITQVGLDYSSAKILPKGSVLFSSRAPIGYVVIAKNEISTSQGFKNLIPTKSLCSEYVYYYFKTIKQIAEKVASGTTFLELSATKFSQILFPLPPLSEQHRIVSKIEELFSELEHAEKGLIKAQKQLEVYRQALLKSAFEGRLTEKWRIENNPIHIKDLQKQLKIERQKRYKSELKDWKVLIDKWGIDEKKGARPKKPKKITYFISNHTLVIPSNWDQVALGNICKKVSSVNSKEQQSDDIFKYIDIGSIDNITNSIVSYKEYKWSNAPSRAKQKIKIGDTLFSTVRTYLKNIAFVDKEHLDNEICSTGFVVLRPEIFINPKYLFYFSINNTFISNINALQSGTSYPSIRNNHVFQQSFPVCSEEEQSQIVQELEFRFTLIDNLEKSIKKGLKETEIYRHSVLKKAFKGKLILQETTDRTTDQLLKEIQIEKELYLSEQKELMKRKPKINRIMKKYKKILELLKDSSVPIYSHKLWQDSIHKDDIEKFYSELKKLDKMIKITIQGKESFIILKDENR